MSKSLNRGDIEVTVVDKRNYHLFQPLLYQVATGGLSPGDISSPLRVVLKGHSNTRVWQARAVGVDARRRLAVLEDGVLPYDTLVVATGSGHTYFGNDHWAPHAPGLKTIEDALDIRRRILLAFETAERETNQERRRAWLTFAIIGAGPTGVELCGALAELSRYTMKHDFRSIDPAEAQIILIEGADRVLPSYPSELSAKAQRALTNLGVKVSKETLVTNIERDTLVVTRNGKEQRIRARTILWAAGVKASSLGQALANETGVQLDRAGKVVVAPDLTVPGHPEIFVIGDLASFTHQSESPLPAVAPVAIQQGRHVADSIKRRIDGRPVKPFRYRDKGNLAVIGRSAAVAHFGRRRFNGFPAWLAWVFVHISYLIEFDNKLIVMIQWAFDYFTRKRGARLITGDDPHPLIPNSGREDPRYEKE